MSGAPRVPASTPPRASVAPSIAPPTPRSPVGSLSGAPGSHFEFSEVHKEIFAGVAASASFVGVCVMLLAVMSALFAVAAAYGGFVAVAGGLVAGAAVCAPLGWWATSAGRSLSALVRTRGRDVTHLMDAVVQLRRLFAFARVFIIVYALAAAAAGALYVWCNFAADKGGRCFAGWG